jgi:SRSO17 transposase
MTEQQLADLGPALACFLDRFLFCCAYTQTFGHLSTYVEGLLSDLPRKSVEPIALRAGTPVRTLQEFLRDHAWDFAAVRDGLQRHAAALLPSLADADGLGTVGLIDETSAAKSGTKTPGVQRQYLGCLGKVDNGIVTVHLGACRGGYQALLDADLYLPQSWSDDRPRCRQAGIPDAVVYRPKWQIALEQLDRTRGNGVALDWLTFDEEYGKRPGFVAGLDHRQQRFVGEVPRSFSCLAAVRSGRRPDEATTGRAAEEVVRASTAFRSQPWQVLRLARQTEADQVWRVKAARVWLSSGAGWSAGTYWLIWASNDATGEEKFFLSNAPADTPVGVLVRVAFRRAVVEHCFRVCKSELGFTHFEGRSYQALMRHLTLGLVALAFVAEHTERLRGEKPGPDVRAGVPGAGRGRPDVVTRPAPDQRAGVGVGHHHLPPGAQPGRAHVQAEEATDRPDPQKASAMQAKTQKPIHSKVNVALYC